MENNTTPYFLQTKEWSDFWLENSEKGHKIHYISHETDEIKLSAYIYQYPWHLRKSFFYVPKSPIFKIKKGGTQTLASEFPIFLKKIIELANQHHICFIKLDFDYHFTDLLDIQDNQMLLGFVRKYSPISVKVSNKSLQYLSTMILDSSRLSYCEDPTEFLEKNTFFWGKTNENIRRYTRKSLRQNWQVDTSKTEQNFNDFWLVYESTAKRQSFAIHPKVYFENMFHNDFVKLIVLRDDQGVPRCCWFGVCFADTLYYLYGGNDEYSFKNHGQYLAHLIALQMAAKKGILSYDLGGYDSEKGFGKFKEGYRGEIVKFLGPIDIVLQPNIYNLVNGLINAVKRLKS